MEQFIKVNFKNMVHIVHKNEYGEILADFEDHNLITTEGIDWVADRLGNANTNNAANYIGLSSDTTDPAVGDLQTGWNSIEYTTAGLSRAQGTYAHTASTSTYTVAKTFTCTSDSQTVAKAALLSDTHATGGKMFAEYEFTAATTLNTNDTLTVTWTITLS